MLVHEEILWRFNGVPNVTASSASEHGSSGGPVVVVRASRTNDDGAGRSGTSRRSVASASPNERTSPARGIAEGGENCVEELVRSGACVEFQITRAQPHALAGC
jgi:hypothetical protein